jgi:hypothetical protein
LNLGLIGSDRFGRLQLTDWGEHIDDLILVHFREISDEYFIEALLNFAFYDSKSQILSISVRIVPGNELAFDEEGPVTL